jgi:beta-lactamase class D
MKHLIRKRKKGTKISDLAGTWNITDEEAEKNETAINQTWKIGNSRTIIDTDILIDLLRNKKEAVDFVTALEKKKFVMSTTSINAFELFYGAHKSNDPEKGIEITKKLLRRMSVLL